MRCIELALSTHNARHYIQYIDRQKLIRCDSMWCIDLALSTHDALRYIHYIDRQN